MLNRMYWMFLKSCWLELENDITTKSEETEFVERTKSVTARELFDQHAQYHSSCYKSITNIEKVQRAKKRYSDSIEIRGPSIS